MDTIAWILIAVALILVAVAAFSLAWFVRGASEPKPYESLYIPPPSSPPRSIYYVDARAIHVHRHASRSPYRQLEDDSEIIDS